MHCKIVIRLLRYFKHFAGIEKDVTIGKVENLQCGIVMNENAGTEYPGISLLYVEDDLSWRKHIQYLMSEKGHEVLVAADGEEGLEIYKTRRPAIVITDIAMPSMNGIELADEIKKIDADAQIIIFSQLEKSVYLVDAINIVVSQFIVKDMDNLPELLYAVDLCARHLYMKWQLEKQASHIDILSRALGQSSSMVVITDEDGKIVFANKKYTEFWGDDQELLPGSCLPAIGEDDFLEIWKSAKAAGTGEGEYRKKSGGRSVVWISSTISQVYDVSGSAAYFIEVANDITERKNYEAALKEAKEAAQRSNLAKSTFLANMSHELRTPLNGIIGMASLVLGTSLSREQFEYISLLKNSGESLLRIIENILEVSRIDTGRLEAAAAPFALDELIRRLADYFRPSVLAKDLEFSWEIAPDMPAGLIGDVGKLQQVLSNLVGNAVKFTEKGCIGLKVYPVKAGGEKVTAAIEVTDTGIGIPEDKIPGLFERFTQVDTSYTRKYGGAGLGLAICKELLAICHGTISVESRVGEGSKFRVEMEFGRQQVPGQTEAAAGRAEAAAGKFGAPLELNSLDILLVEDNLINQKIAAEFLSRRGHNVKAVFNGDDAIRLWRENKYDLILMDIEMPVMNGFQATMKIRSIERQYGGHVPVIALTAHTSKSAVQKCVSSGMDEFVSKPIDFEVLLATIEKALSDNGRKVRAKRPIVNLALIIESFGNDTAMMKKIIARFLEDLPLELERLRTAAINDDYAGVSFSAHKLRSALGSFGADKAAELALKIEKAGKGGNPDDVHVYLHAFDMESANIVDYLTEFLYNKLED